MVGHELDPPHAAQEGPAVQNTCRRELKACFDIKKASNRLLNAQCVPATARAVIVKKKNKTPLKTEKESS